MLRLPERVRGTLLEVGMLCLTAWAMLKPMLRIYMLSQEAGWALLLLIPMAALVAVDWWRSVEPEIVSWRATSLLSASVASRPARV